MNRRSVIISGKTTSISLETVFWEEIDRRAEGRGLSWANYFRELVDDIGEVPNRAAAIKEMLLLKLRGENTQLFARQELTSHWGIKSGHDERAVVLHGLRILVGRGSNADITLSDDEASRVHLMLVFDGGFWWAIDLDSKNGSRIGRKKIKAEKVSHGVGIKIGNSSISLLR